MARVILVPIWGQMGTSKFLSGRATQGRGSLFWGQRISGQEDPRLGRSKECDLWGSDRIPQEIGIKGAGGNRDRGLAAITVSSIVDSRTGNGYPGSLAKHQNTFRRKNAPIQGTNN